MKEVIPVSPKLKIKWKGVFSLSELYSNIKQWLDYQGYGDQEKNFHEKKYVEKIKGDSKEINIKWVAQKSNGDYFAYVISISFVIIGLKEVEIDMDGRKVGTNKGEVEMRISSELIKDRQDKWKIPIIQSLYERYIIKEAIEQHKTDLYSKTYALHDEIKAYFNMHT